MIKKVNISHDYKIPENVQLCHVKTGILTSTYIIAPFLGGKEVLLYWMGRSPSPVSLSSENDGILEDPKSV